MENKKMDGLLKFILNVMSARDPYLQEQSGQVTDLVLEIAHEINLPPVRTATLEFAARIHNIGNIAINECVLHKPGRLTEAEVVMIQQHTILGAKIIEPLEIDPLIRLTILHHHENYDGTGYPHKLKAEEIPIEARIVRIADTYNALIHPRQYRPAYSEEAALTIMEESRQCFDPTLLNAFFKMNSD
jgi:putative two-component system response regulator